MELREEAPAASSPPLKQSVLLLHDFKQPYRLSEEYSRPVLRSRSEVLIRVAAIGLNPIDWKAPDYQFGIPEFPYISGREYSGTVEQIPDQTLTGWAVGDRIIAISTDYRDQRKAAYQEYAIALDYNIIKLPPTLSLEQGSTLGVASVTAALALGVSLGLDFSEVFDGPDLYRLVRGLDPEAIPEDVRHEALGQLGAEERLKRGDWIVIWGGSSTAANLAIQLCRLVGVRVIAVVDCAKHGVWLSNHPVIRPDLLVDSDDPSRAILIIKRATKGELRFCLDTRGPDSAHHLLRALLDESSELEKSETSRVPTPPLDSPTPPSLSSLDSNPARGHLVGMSGLPKDYYGNHVVLHTIPVKLFHEVPELGVALTSWLGRLMERDLIQPPEIKELRDGLGSINGGLDRMRRGEICGGKVVVRVQPPAEKRTLET